MHPYVALATLLALLVYAWIFMRVGQARYKYGVEAPSVTGNLDFERHYRVQVNTIESLVVFLPSLWLFAIFWNADLIAAALGLVWAFGRILYAVGYAKAASSRSQGFTISAVALLILLLGALAGVVWALIKTAM
jgi:glutathione S-transferase